MSLLNKFFGIKREIPAAPHTNVSITNDTSDSGFVMVPNVVNSHQLQSHQLQSGNYSNQTTLAFIMQ